MVGRAHLAFAWEALGDFDKALEMVGNIDPTELKTSYVKIHHH